MIAISLDSNGYERLSKCDRTGKRIHLHIVMAENMFDGKLPNGMEVHHLDENRGNSNHCNLMICESSYHKLQHRRLRSIKAAGVSWYLKCSYCQRYDNPKNMFLRKKTNIAWHRQCHKDYMKKRHAAVIAATSYFNSKEKVDGKKVIRVEPGAGALRKRTKDDETGGPGKGGCRV